MSRRVKDLTPAELLRLADDHRAGKHRKLPRQSCPTCKAERAAQWLRLKTAT